MHPDHLPYIGYMTRADLDKAINSLSGIVEGLTLDGVITTSEAEFLGQWISGHCNAQYLHPFNELIPLVQGALRARKLEPGEREDIRWLCERMRSTEYYNQTTADLQRLHAIVASIVADGKVTEVELDELATWLGNHEYLRTCWPYDEIDSLVMNVMADRKIDEKEQEILKPFFSEFAALTDEQAIYDSLVSESEGTITGLCAVCPEIAFPGSRFCFTGASSRLNRQQFREIVERLGGEFTENVSSKVRYLVIGAEGNPCWAYACYGRKVEQAVRLRKAGAPLLLVHENDFHDALSDQGT